MKITKQQREDLGNMIAEIHASCSMMLSHGKLNPQDFKRVATVRAHFHFLGVTLDQENDINLFSLYCVFVVKQTRVKLSYTPKEKERFKEILDHVSKLMNYNGNLFGNVYFQLIRLIDSAKSFKMRDDKQKDHNEFHFVNRNKDIAVCIKSTFDAFLFPRLLGVGVSLGRMDFIQMLLLNFNLIGDMQGFLAINKDSLILAENDYCNSINKRVIEIVKRFNAIDIRQYVGEIHEANIHQPTTNV